MDAEALAQISREVDRIGADIEVLRRRTAVHTWDGKPVHTFTLPALEPDPWSEIDFVIWGEPDRLAARPGSS